MSKNTELLGDFLSCMVKLTDKLHQTNKKVIELYSNLGYIDVENLVNIRNDILAISGKLDRLEISGSEELARRVINVENRLDNLSTDDIIENDQNVVLRLNQNTEDLKNIQQTRNDLFYLVNKNTNDISQLSGVFDSLSSNDVITTINKHGDDIEILSGKFNDLNVDDMSNQINKNAENINVLSGKFDNLSTTDIFEKDLEFIEKLEELKNTSNSKK